MSDIRGKFQEAEEILKDEGLASLARDFSEYYVERREDNIVVRERGGCFCEAYEDVDEFLEVIREYGDNRFEEYETGNGHLHIFDRYSPDAWIQGDPVKIER